MEENVLVIFALLAEIDLEEATLTLSRTGYMPRFVHSR